SMHSSMKGGRGSTAIDAPTRAQTNQARTFASAMLMTASQAQRPRAATSVNAAYAVSRLIQSQCTSRRVWGASGRAMPSGRSGSSGRVDQTVRPQFAQCDGGRGQDDGQRQRPQAAVDLQAGPGGTAGHETDHAGQGDAGRAPDPVEVVGLPAPPG